MRKREYLYLAIFGFILGLLFIGLLFFVNSIANQLIASGNNFGPNDLSLVRLNTILFFGLLLHWLIQISLAKIFVSKLTNPEMNLIDPLHFGKLIIQVLFISLPGFFIPFFLTFPQIPPDMDFIFMHILGQLFTAISFILPFTFAVVVFYLIKMKQIFSSNLYLPNLMSSNNLVLVVIFGILVNFIVFVLNTLIDFIPIFLVNSGEVPISSIPSLNIYYIGLAVLGSFVLISVLSVLFSLLISKSDSKQPINNEFSALGKVTVIWILIFILTMIARVILHSPSSIDENTSTEFLKYLKFRFSSVSLDNPLIILISELLRSLRDLTIAILSFTMFLHYFITTEEDDNDFLYPKQSET